MKSSSQAEIINNILSPQDAWELFSRLLREYWVKNEAYFFKLICFYYFNIHDVTIFIYNKSDENSPFDTGL